MAQEELWCSMRKSEVVVRYVRVVQNIDEDN